jgi:hypothetical protein
LHLQLQLVDLLTHLVLVGLALPAKGLLVDGRLLHYVVFLLLKKLDALGQALDFARMVSLGLGVLEGLVVQVGLGLRQRPLEPANLAVLLHQLKLIFLTDRGKLGVVVL